MIALLHGTFALSAVCLWGAFGRKGHLAVKDSVPDVKTLFHRMGKGGHMFTKEYWKSSAEKLRSTKYLAIMAATIAMKTALSFFYIPISENLHISFGYLLTAIEGAVLGPVAAAVSGGVTDIVSFMMNPTGPFFFGYTLTAMMGPFIYGLFFYRQKITLPRIIFAKAIVNYGVNVLIGSLWSAMLYSKGYIYYAGKSLIKNTSMLPIEIILLYTIFRLVGPYLERRKLIIKQN